MMMGHGIMGYKSTDEGDVDAATLRQARRVLICTGAQIVTKRLGHNNQGVGQVIWTEINPVTSNRDGHHNYLNRVAPGHMMTILVAEHYLGNMTCGPWGNQDHGSTSSLRVTAWSPVGPLDLLAHRLETAFGDEYAVECRHYATRISDW
jgi:hypothetical protein